MRPAATRLHVTMIAIPDANATVALAEMGGIRVSASSKREPGDRYDPRIGTDLAVARALRKISRKLERRANGAVRHAEHVKAARRAARSPEGVVYRHEDGTPVTNADVEAMADEAERGYDVDAILHRRPRPARPQPPRKQNRKQVGK